MANNERYHNADTLAVVPTNPLVVVSGGPVRYGDMTGVAIDDENAAGSAVVDFGYRVWSLSVTDTVGGGIAVGDTLFYVDGAPGTISNTASGYIFGKALEVVGAGATTTIDVLHVPILGTGVLGTGVVGTAHIAANAVTAAKILEDLTAIVVSTGGSDTTGDGSWQFPYKTLTKALTIASNSRKEIYMLAGEYVEAAMVVWPNINNIAVHSVGGDVVVSEGNSDAAVISLKPAFTSATFGATIGFIVEHTAQIGIDIDNAGMGSRKLNLYLERGFGASQVSTGNSINVPKGVAGQAVRICANDCGEIEGLVNWVT